MASFSKCIALDPRNEVFHSNRAAALTALRRYAEALADGRAATALKPGWAKGWARVGAAYTGLEEHAEVRARRAPAPAAADTRAGASGVRRSQACGAFERALELEPNDRGLQEARHSADVAARKAQAERRHRFKRPLEHGGAHGGRAGAGRVQPSEARAGVKLSFDADDDGG